MSRHKLHFIAVFLFLAATGAIVFYAWSGIISRKLSETYNSRQSAIFKDRNGEIISLEKNSAGFYSEHSREFPVRFKKLLLQKEDRYFYYHPGFNPVSLARGAYYRIIKNKNRAASTITQQLTKVLLGNENNRTLKNKLKELAYAVSLEVRLSKDQILEMYVNSIYFGNQTQGLSSASRLYFGKSPAALTDTEIIRLISAISSPSSYHPFSAKNPAESERIARLLNVDIEAIPEPADQDIENRRQEFSRFRDQPSDFELNSFNLNCQSGCGLTIDQDLTESLRDIMKRNLESLAGKNTTNAAIIVLKEPENELLAIVGSPNPEVDAYGYKLNIATAPRPIGSTIKPFLYLKGFEKDLRPYSKVDDKEYKYIINDGFAFYPKNYDYAYRGEVNLHYALSNSLNVPAVKVLEYVGIDDFSAFLVDDLGLTPLQNINTYQLGLVLGGLEMDLASLAYYFSIFPNNGVLKPLRVSDNSSCLAVKLSADLCQNKKIAAPAYIELINKILSDRQTGTEQFGAKSSLNLPYPNYAVKTGTSREYHDSWTIGYTPDFVVGVWAGNHDDTPMDAVSGQSGAGRIWQEAMQAMYNSKYNRDTPFRYSQITGYPDEAGIEYGLPGDDYEKFKNLLSEDRLILKPYDGDIFSLDDKTKIILKSNEDVKWYINGNYAGSGQDNIFQPNEIGNYEIKAIGRQEEEKIEIVVKSSEL